MWQVLEGRTTLTIPQRRQCQQCDGQPDNNQPAAAGTNSRAATTKPMLYTCATNTSDSETKPTTVTNSARRRDAPAAVTGWRETGRPAVGETKLDRRQLTPTVHHRQLNRPPIFGRLWSGGICGTIHIQQTTFLKPQDRRRQTSPLLGHKHLCSKHRWS